MCLLQVPSPWRTWSPSCLLEGPSTWCSWRAPRWGKPSSTQWNDTATAPGNSSKCPVSFISFLSVYYGLFLDSWRSLCRFFSTSTFGHAELVTDVSTSVTFPTGFHVEFDLSKPSGSRVRSLDILCTQCRVPQYEPVEDEAVYTVVLPSYMMTGGDGFSMIKNETLKHNSGEKFGYFSGFRFFGGILSWNFSFDSLFPSRWSGHFSRVQLHHAEKESVSVRWGTHQVLQLSVWTAGTDATTGFTGVTGAALDSVWERVGETSPRRRFFLTKPHVNLEESTTLMDIILQVWKYDSTFLSFYFTFQNKSPARGDSFFQKKKQKNWSGVSWNSVWDKFGLSNPQLRWLRASGENRQVLKFLSLCTHKRS